MFSVQRVVVPQQVEIYAMPVLGRLRKEHCWGSDVWDAILVTVQAPISHGRASSRWFAESQDCFPYVLVYQVDGVQLWLGSCVVLGVVVRGMGPPCREGLFAHAEQQQGCMPCKGLIRSQALPFKPASESWVL